MSLGDASEPHGNVEVREVDTDFSVAPAALPEEIIQ